MKTFTVTAEKIRPAVFDGGWREEFLDTLDAILPMHAKEIADALSEQGSNHDDHYVGSVLRGAAEVLYRRFGLPEWCPAELMAMGDLSSHDPERACDLSIRAAVLQREIGDEGSGMAMVCCCSAHTLMEHARYPEAVEVYELYFDWLVKNGPGREARVFDFCSDYAKALEGAGRSADTATWQGWHQRGREFDFKGFCRAWRKARKGGAR